MENLAQWFSGITGIIWAIIALGIMIFAHELGHFMVAKLSGVGVLKFSLGFGKKLVGRKVGETEYLISALPLGGYVKLLGEEDGEELPDEDKARSFSNQPVWKRFAIVFAGPVFNIFLAVLLCYIVMLTGDPTPIARVADVVPGGLAAGAGIRQGDIIRAVDGNPVLFWEQVSAYAEEHPGTKVDLTVEKNGLKSDVGIELPAQKPWEGLGLIGSVIVAARKDGSPAALAGIQANDRVVSVDGVRVGTWEQMAEIIMGNPGKEMELTYEHEGETIQKMVTPEESDDPENPGKKIGLIGVIRGYEEVEVSYGPVEAVGKSLDRTYRLTDLTVSFLAKIIGGEEKASNVGGPIAIVQLSERQAKQGFADFVLFMAILSINLGIINLVPIPILDGGHLFFLGLEAVMGKPLSMRKREIAQQIGLVLIIMLMAFVFSVDILRWLGFIEMWR